MNTPLTMTQLADKMGISQPAVSYRIKTGSLPVPEMREANVQLFSPMQVKTILGQWRILEGARKGRPGIRPKAK